MLMSEFVANYCARSGITEAEFREQMVALPCACDSEMCEGWAAIFLGGHFIAHHMAFNSPNAAALHDIQLSELRAAR